jgi:tetratricopeptide (TPR) repeat protein
MARFELDRRALTLLAFPGLILVGFLVELLVLGPRVAARPPADEVRYWEAHVARNQSYPASRVRLGLAYQEVARLDDAQRAYEAALALDPDQEAATIGRYGILDRKHERDRALADLEAFARDHPRCAVCWHNLAAAYLEQGRLDAAAAAAESLLASGLTLTSGMYDATDLHAEAYLMAGRVYAARGEHARAIALFRDAIAREPRDVRGHLNLARSLIASGEAEAATAALDHAEARLAPGDAARRAEIARLRGMAERSRAGG